MIGRLGCMAHGTLHFTPYTADSLYMSMLYLPGVGASAIKANLKRKAARVVSLLQLQLQLQAYTCAMRHSSLTDSIAHVAVPLS
jgi:hypothetical protein